MIWLLAILWIGLPLASWKWKGTLFTPWSLYAISQFGGMTFSLLKLHPAMTDPSTTTWAIFWFSAAAFFLGCIVASGKGMVIDPGRYYRWIPAVWLIFGFFSVLWLSSVLDGYLRAGGWPAFQASADKAREAYASRSGIMWYTSQMGAVQGLLGLMVAFTATSRWMRWLGWLGWGAAVWVSFASGMRFGIVTLLVTLVIFIDSNRKRISPLQAIAFLLLLGAGLSAMFIFRQTHLQSFVDSIRIPWDQKFRLAVLPIYTYIANCFWNFDSGVSAAAAGEYVEWGMGYWSFQGALFFTHLHVGLNNSYGFISNYFSFMKLPELNTASWQWFVYMDFGWLGVMIFAFVWGAIATWLGRLANKHVVYAILNAYMLFYVAMSFFTLFSMIPEMVLASFVLCVVIAIDSRMPREWKSLKNA